MFNFLSNKLPIKMKEKNLIDAEYELICKRIIAKRASDGVETHCDNLEEFLSGIIFSGFLKKDVTEEENAIKKRCFGEIKISKKQRKITMAI